MTSDRIRRLKKKRERDLVRLRCNPPGLYHRRDQRCDVCNRLLVKDHTFQVLTASHEETTFNVAMDYNKAGRTTLTFRLDDKPTFIHKHVLVCESCCITASFIEVGTSSPSFLIRG